MLLSCFVNVIVPLVLLRYSYRNYAGFWEFGPFDLLKPATLRMQNIFYCGTNKARF